MGWLIGIYYVALLGFLFFVFPLGFDEPVILGLIMFFAVWICVIPAVVFVKQKRKYNKDIDFAERNARAEAERHKAETEKKINEINGEIERLNSINLLETDKALNRLDKHLKRMVPIMSGEVYEAYVGYRLAYSGWAEITFTPVTGDYGADIIAIDKDGHKTCIQCKRYDNPVGVDAVQEVLAARQYYGAERAVVATNSTMTLQARNMAQRTDVELWEQFV